ncbi:MAG: hypothetical protein JKY98_05265 [Gammaproteobacteria bacterium]|nr:hypothetical protein [Gammaproteobacteria bacterium]
MDARIYPHPPFGHNARVNCTLLIIITFLIGFFEAPILWCLVPFSFFAAWSHWYAATDITISLELDPRLAPGFEIAHLRRMIAGVAATLIGYGVAYYVV